MSRSPVTIVALGWLTVTSLAVACASSNDAPPSTEPNDDPGTRPPSDGGTTNPMPDASSGGTGCSRAGWCTTPLPDEDLEVRDIWPFETRAFAIAESSALGVKVLEWTDATRSWSYIDDNAQNAFGRVTYAGKIWAPSENEVYFGASPAFIHHGTRASTSEPWSWERSSLAPDPDAKPDPNRDPGRVAYVNRDGNPLDVTALGVWGTSPDDVYAWYGKTIFHRRTGTGGVADWVAEYVAEDSEHPDDAFFVFGAAASAPDDVWFAGGRGLYDDSGIHRCPVLVHRTPSGYRRVVDTIIDGSDVYFHYYGSCQPKAGFAMFGNTNIKGDSSDWINGGWLTSIDSVGTGRVAGILGEEHFAYVESGTSGANDLARVNQVVARVPRPQPPAIVGSVWIHDEVAWISGWGIVLRTARDPARWSKGLGLFTPADAHDLGIDAATFDYSSTAYRGAPLDEPLHQVRGTSNENLWAIGRHHALHKTTP